MRTRLGMLLKFLGQSFRKSSMSLSKASTKLIVTTVVAIPYTKALEV